MVLSSEERQKGFPLRGIRTDAFADQREEKATGCCRQKAEAG